MRTVFPLLSALILLGGCAKTTAYDYFKMDEQHERAVSNLRTETIVKDQVTKAIISSVYLNRVMPESFHDNDTFYIALYLADNGELYNEEGEAAEGNVLLLNGMHPVAVQNADENMTLRSLMPVKNDWNHYYIVEYPGSDEAILRLTLESDLYGQAHLEYQRDDE